MPASNSRKGGDKNWKVNNAIMLTGRKTNLNCIIISIIPPRNPIVNDCWNMEKFKDMRNEAL
jgi:hypothetical protein